MSRKSNSNNSVLDGLKAFQMAYGLTQGIMDKRGSADAYNAGSAVTENTATTGGERTEQAAPTDPNYVQNPEYTGEAGQDKYIYAGDAASAGAAPGVQAEYSAPTPTSQQTVSYGMGGKTYDTAPTDSQKAAAGLSGAGKYYASTGNVEEAARLGRLAQQTRQQDGQDELAGLSLVAARRTEQQARLNESELKKFHSVMQSFEDPAKAAQYIRDAYAKDIGYYGQGEHAGQQIQFQAHPDGGGIAWTTDANGKQTSDAKYYAKDQIIKEARNSYWMNTDPAGYAKAVAAQAAKAEERGAAREDRNAAEDHAQKNRIALEEVKKAGRIEVNAARPAAAGGAGLSTAEIRNVDYLVKGGMDPAEARRMVWSRKSVAPSTVVISEAGSLPGDPPKVKTKVTTPGAPAKPAASSIPAGAKRVGTDPDGKVVYELGGKRYRDE